MVKWADNYAFDNVMLSFANDFAFNDAKNAYGLMDDIIKIVNEGSDLIEI
jgi:hypothetical protein